MLDMKPGIYIFLRYVAPRKRKARSFGNSAATFEEAFEKLKNWRAQYGGKFLEGEIINCQLYQIESDGKKHWMQSVPIFAPGQPLTLDQIQELNGIKQ